MPVFTEIFVYPAFSFALLILTRQFMACSLKGILRGIVLWRWACQLYTPVNILLCC